MPAPPVPHLLFDFFGTLVEYAPGPGQGCARTYGVTRDLGATLPHREFLAAWARVTAHLGRLSAVDDREYPMIDLGTACLREVLGRAPGRAETGLLVRAHLAVHRAAWHALRVDPAPAVSVGDTYRAGHLGPTRAGVRALLVDPHRRARVPEEARLASVFALPARLAELGLTPPASS